MIQVKENSSKGLKHELTVTVPHAEIEKNMTRRLQEIGKTARIQGFRPGKAPLAILRQRYGESVGGDVRHKTITDSVAKILTDRNLKPALQPKVDVISDGDGKDLAFTMTVEVLPDIAPMDFGKLSLEKPTTDVADSAVDETVERLVKSVREPEAVTEARKAQKGDVLIVDFDGTVDGTAHPGMKGENHTLELGSQSFVGTFEDQLVGAKAGDKKKIKVDFPHAYHAPHLAGKTAEFAVTVKELKAHKPVELTDETAKEVGFSSLAELRKRIGDDIAANYNRISRSILKRQLMDKLADGHDFPIPEGLLETEFASIWQEVLKEKEHGHLTEEDAKKSDDDLRQEYRGIAERRIRLGLLLAEVAQRNNIGVTQGDLRNAMIVEARRFPGQEKAVVDYYLKTEGAIERLRAPILEDKVVDFILAQAKITDKKISADELMKLPESMD
jgi:trigger factor